MADETPVGDIEYLPAGYTRIGATDAFKTAVINFIGAQGGLISLHSDDPGTTGANEIPSTNGYTRQTTTWGTTPAMDSVTKRAVITGSLVTFSVPTGSVTYYAVRKADGTFLYGKALQPGVTLNSPGTISITPTHAYGLL